MTTAASTGGGGAHPEQQQHAHEPPFDGDEAPGDRNRVGEHAHQVGHRHDPHRRGVAERRQAGVQDEVVERPVADRAEQPPVVLADEPQGVRHAPAERDQRDPVRDRAQALRASRSTRPRREGERSRDRRQRRERPAASVSSGLRDPGSRPSHIGTPITTTARQVDGAREHEDQHRALCDALDRDPLAAQHPGAQARCPPGR